MARDGFQPCIMDTGAPVPMPHWERNLVVVALIVHVMDVGLDLCVAILFVAHAQWVFLMGAPDFVKTLEGVGSRGLNCCVYFGVCGGAAGVIFWAWLVCSPGLCCLSDDLLSISHSRSQAFTSLSVEELQPVTLTMTDWESGPAAS
ncbi:unnamed protein product [Effrenium voratum]|nr:unnamed protein product [Effrenium voratum]